MVETKSNENATIIYELESIDALKKLKPESLLEKWINLPELPNQEDFVWATLRYLRAFKCRRMVSFDDTQRVVSLSNKWCETGRKHTNDFIQP